jgi:hypothetical protein
MLSHALGRHHPWQQTVDELQRVGCCGIEARVPLTVEEQRSWPTPAGVGAGVYRHSFQRRRRDPRPGRNARAASGAPADRFAEAKALNPRFVNLLAGNDRWPLAQQVDFLGKAHELAAGFG